MLIVATSVLPLLHTPPATLLLSGTLWPVHTLDGPEIGPGIPYTVKVIVVLQPVLSVLMMVAVPAPMPVTNPVVASIYATPGSVLLHEPPGVASLSVVVWPTHRLVIPVIGSGSGLMATVFVW